VNTKIDIFNQKLKSKEKNFHELREKLRLIEESSKFIIIDLVKSERKLEEFYLKLNNIRFELFMLNKDETSPNIHHIHRTKEKKGSQKQHYRSLVHQCHLKENYKKGFLSYVGMGVKVSDHDHIQIMKDVVEEHETKIIALYDKFDKELEKLEKLKVNLKNKKNKIREIRKKIKNTQEISDDFFPYDSLLKRTTLLLTKIQDEESLEEEIKKITASLENFQQIPTHELTIDNLRKFQRSTKELRRKKILLSSSPGSFLTIFDPAERYINWAQQKN